MSEQTYTMDEIRDAFNRAHTIATGGRAHYMSIPLDFKRDADLILQSAIDELERRRASPAAIVEALEKAKAEWDQKYPLNLEEPLAARAFDNGFVSGLTKAIEIVKEHK